MTAVCTHICQIFKNRSLKELDMEASPPGKQNVFLYLF